MTFSSRLTPQDQFPEQLEALTTDALEILNSKLHRQAELEYQQEGEPELETRFRLEFLTEELDRRESLAAPLAETDSQTIGPAAPDSVPARMANA